MKKSGMFVYIYGRTYVILYFDPRVFVLAVARVESGCGMIRLVVATTHNE